MNGVSHIIERVNVDVEVADMATARHIRDNVRGFLMLHVFPELERMFGDGFEPDRIYRADRLDVDLTFESGADFEARFSQAVIDKVVNAMTGRKAASADLPGIGAEVFERLSIGEQRWEIFLFFLQYGSLPWYAGRPTDWLNEAELVSWLHATSGEWRRSFAAIARSHTVVIHRLVRQFTPHFISQFLESFLLATQVDVKDARRSDFTVMISNAGVDVLLFFVFVIKKVSSAGYVLPVGFETTEELIAEYKLYNTTDEVGKIVLESTVEPETQQQKDDEDMRKGTYVSHAGLILLHPFLQYFFKELELLDGKDFRDKAARDMAIHLLHFLATGDVNPPEYDMVMEKYLCGMYIYEPVDRFVILTEKMKSEAKQLLDAVVGHWTALKSTSADGLREGFLQRNGKLLSGGMFEQLIVESKAMDILLEKLPWGYSIISLPWLKKPLHIDWSTTI